jgi:diguanylate cyclase (GGDEF)-like protein
VFALLPRDNPQQALRLRRFFMAGGTYLMFFVLMVLAWRLSLMELYMVTEIVAAGVVINIAFYGVFRSGLNLRFKDPSLTAPQVVIAIGLVSYGMYCADTARGAFLLVYLVIVLFGVFRLARRALLIIGVLALCAYGAVILLAWGLKPAATRLEVEVLQWAVLGAVLPWFALLGGYLNGLRKKMREKNLQLQQALSTIQEMATHDDLTGTYNRRYFTERLAAEKNRSDRGKGNLCVCMIDIDHFKEVNDQFGHPAGDRVLQSFAQVSQTDLRATDCFARYGGEEFALSLSETPLDGAIVMAERIRHRVENTAFPDLGPGRTVTASIGIAQYRPPEDIDDTLLRADRALYAAKAAGRNRVNSAG